LKLLGFKIIQRIQ